MHDLHKTRPAAGFCALNTAPAVVRNTVPAAATAAAPQRPGYANKKGPDAWSRPQEPIKKSDD